MQKTLHLLGSCAENFPLIQISSIVFVNFTRHVTCDINAGECFDRPAAPQQGSFGCLMTSLILITMDNGRGHYARPFLPPQAILTPLPNMTKWPINYQI